MKPSLNSISSPSTVIERNVVLHAGLRRERQIGGVGRQKPAHVGALELEQAGHALRARAGAPRIAATAPNSQISRSKKWMPMFVTMPPERSSRALPRHVVPGAARGDVGQADVVRRAGRSAASRSRSAISSGCSAQLQHGVDAACRSRARAPASASRFHGLMTSGFSQIASAPTRSASRMCASCR